MVNFDIELSCYWNLQMADLDQNLDFDFDPLKNQFSKIAAPLFCIIPKAISRPNFSIIELVDSRNNSILCQN